MATTEMTQIARELGPETTTLLLAMDVIRRHVDALSPEDRDDLVKALGAGFTAQTDEEKMEAFTTMLEILRQEKICASEMQPDAARPTSIQKWADHIAVKIRSLRKERNWTQDQLAEKSGLPQSHVSRLELGQHSPSHVTIEKLAKAFGIGPGELDPSR